MATLPVHLDRSTTAATPAWHRYRSSGRRAVAALAAGSLLTAVLGLSGPATAATAAAAAGGTSATTVDWSTGRGGWGSGGPGTTTQGSTADSSPATAAQSTGVALVDTVLTNGAGAGTGIVLTSDGQVLTNYHVVEGSTSITVTLPTSGGSRGTTYTARVVGADQDADVALLQLKDASGLTVATIDDDTLQVGDDVTAVGNAGGTGWLFAADGEVTDLSASITTASEGSVEGESLTKLIETSADVVAGDSGGPLLDDEGEVVGVDTAASSGQEIDGYAVPIATALAVVAQIRSGQETAEVRIGPAAFLGVQVATTTTSDAAYGYGYRRQGSATGSGATIAGVVDGSAADEAGLAAGDTITRAGSTSITTAADLTTAVATRNPGDRVAVTWTTSDGQQKSATLTLGASPLN